MGNRAVLQFGQSRNSLGIYLHWNGGKASVQGFFYTKSHFKDGL